MSCETICLDQVDVSDVNVDQEGKRKRKRRKSLVDVVEVLMGYR